LKDAVSPAEAVRAIGSGMKVFIHGAAATPTPLIDALAAREDLENVTTYHLHLEGRVAIAEPEQAGRFRPTSLFTGASLRQAVNDGRADFVPVFLSDIPLLFSSRRIPLDAALLQLSPPDKHGYCTLGTSADAAVAAARTANVLIAEINEQMPRTHGNTLVPFSALTRTSTRIAPFLPIRRPRRRRRRRRSEITSRRSCPTAPPCSSGSARFPTRCFRASSTSTISACTRRCSRTA
jgi:acyl-CoA hydrolase